jgi:hypothetical protein
MTATIESMQHRLIFERYKWLIHKDGTSANVIGLSTAAGMQRGDGVRSRRCSHSSSVTRGGGADSMTIDDPQRFAHPWHLRLIHKSYLYL